MRVLPVVLLAMVSACGGAAKSQSTKPAAMPVVNPPIAQTPPAPPPEEPAKPAAEAPPPEQVAVMDPDDGHEVTGELAGKGIGPGGGGTGTGTIGLGQIGTRGSGGGTGAGAPARRPARQDAQVQIGNVTVKGNLSSDIVKRVLKRHYNELRYCYELRLRADPIAGGVLVVKYVIDPTGKVQTAMASGVHKDLEGCVANRIARWEFPKPPDGGPVMVTQPLTFSPR